MDDGYSSSTCTNREPRTTFHSENPANAEDIIYRQANLKLRVCLPIFARFQHVSVQWNSGKAKPLFRLFCETKIAILFFGDERNLAVAQINKYNLRTNADNLRVG
jgi:hypothetical protein